ncbi:MAG: hypothetical protein ACE5E6_04490 [Phycisphaerae bacterium]
MAPPWITIGVFVLLLLTIGVVVLAAALLWRDGFKRGWRRARHAPPVCPGCGYNLSGLTQCRCPECGRTYRLDELWQTPVPRAAVSAGAEKNATNTVEKATNTIDAPRPQGEPTT